MDCRNHVMECCALARLYLYDETDVWRLWRYANLAHAAAMVGLSPVYTVDNRTCGWRGLGVSKQGLDGPRFWLAYISVFVPLRSPLTGRTPRRPVAPLSIADCLLLCTHPATTSPATRAVFMGFVREQGLFDFGEDGESDAPVSSEHRHELQTIIDLNMEGARPEHMNM